MPEGPEEFRSFLFRGTTSSMGFGGPCVGATVATCQRHSARHPPKGLFWFVFGILNTCWDPFLTIPSCRQFRLRFYVFVFVRDAGK